MRHPLVQSIIKAYENYRNGNGETAPAPARPARNRPGKASL